ncbi:MAG: hypothetical protein DWH99_14075, partial [Planctomycetota bacterium]
MNNRLTRSQRRGSRYFALLSYPVVLSPPQRTVLVLVLVLEAVQDSYPAHWSASYREPCRSKIAAVQTAIEYEYR